MLFVVVQLTIFVLDFDLLSLLNIFYENIFYDL